MGKIYIIKNDINTRVYIGQTKRTLDRRFNEHIRQNDMVISKAIAKYGYQHFHIELIEECEDSRLNEREIYWISQYNSYHDGYNSTLGGNSYTYEYYTEEEKEPILQEYNQGKSILQIESELGFHHKTIVRYLKSKNITHEDIVKRYLGDRDFYPPYTEENKQIILDLWDLGYGIAEIDKELPFNIKTIRSYIKKKGITDEEVKERANQKKRENHAKKKTVIQYDLEGNFIKEWGSTLEASEFLNLSSSAVRNVCNNYHLTVGGFKWKYKEDVEKC